MFYFKTRILAKFLNRDKLVWLFIKVFFNLQQV